MAIVLSRHETTLLPLTMLKATRCVRHQFLPGYYKCRNIELPSASTALV